MLKSITPSMRLLQRFRGESGLSPDTHHATTATSPTPMAMGFFLAENPLACLIGRCLTLESASACASRCAKASALSTLQIPLPLPYTRPGASLASPTEFSVSPLLFLTNVSSIPDAQPGGRSSHSQTNSTHFLPEQAATDDSELIHRPVAQ